MRNPQRIFKKVQRKDSLLFCYNNKKIKIKIDIQFKAQAKNYSFYLEVSSNEASVLRT